MQRIVDDLLDLSRIESGAGRRIPRRSTSSCLAEDVLAA
jgi:signal transduction histidine kinase